MKILVLSCSTGGGHNACAKYIVEEFRKNNILCDFKDYFDIIGPKASKRAETLYLNTTKGNGKLFKGIYKLGEIYSKTKFTSPVYLLNKIAKNKLQEYINMHNYNIVIATHLFPAMAVTALKKDNINIKLINVATDYQAIPFWEETTPDYFVIPHSSLKKEFINKGFSQEILLPFGIPVSSEFLLTKSNLKLPKNKPIILIVSGSMGFGKVKDIVILLLKEFVDAYIITICGNNDNLYNELCKIDNKNLLVKKFVNNINEYMKSSTVILSKPGGLSSTEIAIINKPLVHIFPIPGVENYNANFFSKHKLCLVSKSLEEILKNTKKLLNNEKLQNTMLTNQKKFINSNAAIDLVNFVKDNLN